MPARQLTREVFERRFQSAFVDPAFSPLRRELTALTDAAWGAYADSRKAPLTRKAGSAFADPNYDLSVDWLAARDAVMEAQRRHDDPAGPSRILLVNGSSRTEHTCPGEMSKSWRLIELAQRTLAQRAGFAVDIPDLSRTTSEFGRTIHPCKSCVSTAMPLCHWPCSCYPNYALGQVHDWMNAIYPLWVAAHGIMVITPVNWHQAPGPLKAMMDRLVCADGGNPDPTSTHGKKAEEAKALELAGWSYPRHLAGRLFAVVVHGDTIGAETLRRAMTDWASDMHLVPAGRTAELDRYVGYYEPYATSHHAPDEDEDFQKEVANAASALAEAVAAKRKGLFVEGGADLKEPRPK
jgi:multimeric flavodoxin WrbA